MVLGIGVLKIKSLKIIKDYVLTGKLIDKKQTLSLVTEPLDELCLAANEIREFFCGNNFDRFTIINGKSGKCSEDCKYCAKSISYETKVKQYPLLETKS